MSSQHIPSSKDTWLKQLTQVLSYRLTQKTSRKDHKDRHHRDRTRGEKDSEIRKATCCCTCPCPCLQSCRPPRRRPLAGIWGSIHHENGGLPTPAPGQPAWPSTGIGGIPNGMLKNGSPPVAAPPDGSTPNGGMPPLPPPPWSLLPAPGDHLVAVLERQPLVRHVAERRGDDDDGPPRWARRRRCHRRPALPAGEERGEAGGARRRGRGRKEPARRVSRTCRAASPPPARPARLRRLRLPERDVRHCPRRREHAHPRCRRRAYAVSASNTSQPAATSRICALSALALSWWWSPAAGLFLEPGGRPRGGERRPRRRRSRRHRPCCWAAATAAPRREVVVAAVVGAGAAIVVAEMQWLVVVEVAGAQIKACHLLG